MRAAPGLPFHVYPTAGRPHDFAAGLGCWCEPKAEVYLYRCPDCGGVMEEDDQVVAVLTHLPEMTRAHA